MATSAMDDTLTPTNTKKLVEGEKCEEACMIRQEERHLRRFSRKTDEKNLRWEENTEKEGERYLRLEEALWLAGKVTLFFFR